MADDVANRRIIGFSPDGAYFSFQEFGLENRTNYPYANLYVIDTRRNKWVKGTPFRTILKQPGSRPAQARRVVERKAAKLLSRLAIQRRRVRILASNPISELDGNPHQVTVNPTLSIASNALPLVFSIREYPLTPTRCKKWTRRPILGMEITVHHKGRPKTILHTDKRIPKSRGCPLRYAISDVVQLRRRRHEGAVYAVIYSIIRMGPHGLERRFIAGGYHEQIQYRMQNDRDEILDYSDYDTPYQYRQSDQKDFLDEDIDPDRLRDAYKAPLDAPYKPPSYR